MKALIASAMLLASVGVSAIEIKVMEIPAAKLRNSMLSTRFNINLDDGTAAVALKATRHIGSPKNRTTITKSFEREVPALKLEGQDLVLNAGFTPVVCGSMGETRILKRPVLKLSGNCDIITRKTGKTVSVIIVAE